MDVYGFLIDVLRMHFLLITSWHGIWGSKLLGASSRELRRAFEKVENGGAKQEKGRTRHKKGDLLTL